VELEAKIRKMKEKLSMVHPDDNGETDDDHHA
jgi:hypothetical protein